MAKPDPALLDAACYPFAMTIEPRFGDLDTNMHINNASMVGILEDVRVRYHGASGFRAAMADGVGAMVASFAVEFLGQGYYPDPLNAHAGALRIGNTSYELGQLLTQNGRTVAFARSIMVCIRNGRPTPIPEAFASSVNDWMARA